MMSRRYSQPRKPARFVEVKKQKAGSTHGKSIYYDQFGAKRQSEVQSIMSNIFTESAFN